MNSLEKKCLSISTTLINYIEQGHGWVNEGHYLLAKYYYSAHPHLAEFGNEKLSNIDGFDIKAIKHSNLTLSMNTRKYKATTALTGEDFPSLSRHST